MPRCGPGPSRCWRGRTRATSASWPRSRRARDAGRRELMDHYLVISADCHAGLPNEEYAEWLDPRYRPAFDEFLAGRAALQDQLRARGMRNDEFADEWFTENEE